MRFVRRAVLGVICLLLATAAHAQVTTADILGRVTDSSGAVLPGVSVTVVNTATRDTRSQTTNDTGDYVFNLLPIGTVCRHGRTSGISDANDQFERRQRRPRTVRPQAGSGNRQREHSGHGGSSRAADRHGDGRRTLHRQGRAGSAGRGAQHRPARADDPRRERRPGQLDWPTAHGPDDRRQTSSVSINGTADTQNNQLLDGMDNNERAIGTVGVKPSIDAIAEVKVQTNLYSAETGRTLGGVINILTKSGSNEFHGTAYDYVRNDRFDARSYFAATKPKLTQNQFGGSIGGPDPHGQDVLLRRLRGVPLHAGCGEPDYGPDGPDARR